MNIEVRLEQATDNIDQGVARAARVSIKGHDQPESFHGSLIHRLYRDKHMSCFEHNSITFAVKVPIFVSRELVRHRTLSFNEESARYKKMNHEFYVPHQERPVSQTGKAMDYELEADPIIGQVAHDVIAGQSEWAWQAYETMLEKGVAREVARMVLPVNLMTSLYVTGNLRNWLAFLDLRVDNHALYEIRYMAVRVAEHLEDLAPITMEAWRNDGLRHR